MPTVDFGSEVKLSIQDGNLTSTGFIFKYYPQLSATIAAQPYTDEITGEVLVRTANASNVLVAQVYFYDALLINSTVKANATSRLTFDLRKLPSPANTTLIVKLYAKHSYDHLELLSSRNIQYIKLSYSKPYQITVDMRRRTLLLGGRPFAPIGWFIAELIPLSYLTPVLQDLARRGFNFIKINRSLYSYSLHDTLRLLDVANAVGVRVILELCDIPEIRDRRPCIPKVFSPQHWGKITTLVKHVQDHPGLLGFYLDDDVPDAEPSSLKLYYDHVKSLDPWHPCFVAIAGSGETWRYGGLSGPSFDVAMVEVYVPSTDYAQTGLEIDIVSSFPLDWLPMWGCIMGSNFFGGSSLSGTRQQSYLSIVHKGTGIAYFIYDFPFQEYQLPGRYDDPTTTASLAFQQAQLVSAELFELQQSIISSEFISVNVTLVSGPWPRGGAGTARVYQDQNFASREEFSGCVHIVAVNTAPWPDIIRVQLNALEWPTVLNATAPFESNRPVQFLNGVLEEPIGYLGTRVYRFDCSPASLLPDAYQTIQNLFQNPDFEVTIYPGTPNDWGISRMLRLVFYY
eukprot:gene12481-14747_t